MLISRWTTQLEPSEKKTLLSEEFLNELVSLLIESTEFEFLQIQHDNTTTD